MKNPIEVEKEIVVRMSPRSFTVATLTFPAPPEHPPDRLEDMMAAMAKLRNAALLCSDYSYERGKLEAAMAYVRGQIDGYFRAD